MEKVGTLGLRATIKNRCGTAKKRVRKARLAEAPSGDSGGGQPRSALGDQPHTMQKPGTSGVQWSKPTESGGLPTGTSKWQRLAGGTPDGGQAKRPKQGGQLSYARVAREGLHVAVVCEDYPESQISKENFTDIQRTIGRLVDELKRRGSHPGWLIPAGRKGWSSWFATMNWPRTGWLPGYLPSRCGRAPGSS